MRTNENVLNLQFRECNKCKTIVPFEKNHFKCEVCDIEYIKIKGKWFSTDYKKLIKDILQLEKYIERRFGKGTYIEWWKEINESK